MFLNLPSYILRKVSKTSQQSYSRILWRNITATSQRNSAMEFYGRILQQCYSKTVPQQNSLAKCSNIIAGQYHSRILWQNTTTLQQDSIVEFCGRIQQHYSRTVPQQNSVAESSNVTAGQYRSRILWQNVAALQQDSTIAEFCGIIQQRYSKTVSQQNSVAECNSVTAGQYRSRNLQQNTATFKQSSIMSKILWQNTTISQQSSMALHQNAIANITTTPQSSTTKIS